MIKRIKNCGITKPWGEGGYYIIYYNIYNINKRLRYIKYLSILEDIIYNI